MYTSVDAASKRSVMPACAPNEVHGVVVVLCQAGADGQDVRVEDDVLRVEANVLHEDAVCPLADAHLQCQTERLRRGAVCEVQL